MTAPVLVETDITIREGDSFEHEFTVTTDGSTAMDLTGYAVSAQVREQKNPDASLRTALTATIVSPATSGVIRVTRTGPETEAANITPWIGEAWWDCKITTGPDVVRTVRKGRAYHERKVTT